MSTFNIAIVIPCYNEAGRFPLADYETFLQKENDVFLLFVNDGSTDNTTEILQALVGKFPSRVNVEHLPKNAGKGEAVRHGIMHLSAKQQPIADYLGYLDADLSTPLSEMIRFAANFESQPSLQFIAGSRVKLFGSTNIERFRYRHYFGRIMATLISESLGIAIYDTQCGAKLFKAEIATTLFSKPFISKWLFDVELFFRLIASLGREHLEDKVIEIPVKAWTEKGHSKITFRDLLKIPIDLWKIRNAYRNN